MLRSRDIPESKSASESDHYSDFEIVCHSWQPRRAWLFVIVAAGESNCELLSRSAMEQGQFTGSCIAPSGSGLASPSRSVLVLAYWHRPLQDMKLD